MVGRSLVTHRDAQHFFFLPVLAVHLVAHVRRRDDRPPISGKMECGHI